VCTPEALPCLILKRLSRTSHSRQRQATLCGGVLGAQTLPTTTALASELLLQILSDEVATALASSALLQPYFHGRLGPKAFLVRPETAHELGKKLPAYGLSICSDLLFAGPQSLLAADHG
jgi:hypothetical protein